VLHYFAYVWRHDVQCHGVDGCPGESRSCWDVLASSVPVQERLRGWWRRGCSSNRFPRAGSRVPLTGGGTRHSGWRGGVQSPHASIVSGMVVQWPGWRRGGGDGRATGVGGAVAGRDSQARSGVDSPLTWTPVGVSALNAPVGGAGIGAAARDALERDRSSLEGVFGSRSRRGLARGVRPPPERGGFPLEGRPTLERGRTSIEGATDPRVRQMCIGAALYPSSRVEFRPRVAGPIVCRAVGPRVRFVRVFRFVCVCFYEFKRVSPGCLGDPYGCPRHT
jgi:hypothetical protein